jgi:catechol 2,3-dioxygenase-like lactoylglutathione lyase family enzyme
MNLLKRHVSPNVANIDASVAFYEKAFGVPATKRRRGHAKFDLQTNAGGYRVSAAMNHANATRSGSKCRG